MNTPTEQVTLYRKAADTIEMCAKHGLMPVVKHCGNICNVYVQAFCNKSDNYEFPVAILEGQLVWDDTVVYNSLGRAITARHMKAGFDYTLTQPKPKTVMVEFLVEDAERISNFDCPVDRVATACRKALDNLKDR